MKRFHTIDLNESLNENRWKGLDRTLTHLNLTRIKLILMLLLISHSQTSRDSCSSVNEHLLSKIRSINNLKIMHAYLIIYIIFYMDQIWYAEDHNQQERTTLPEREKEYINTKPIKWRSIQKMVTYHSV